MKLLLLVSCALCMMFVGGCGEQKHSVSPARVQPAVKPESEPLPKKSLPVSAMIEGLRFTLTDNKTGATIADVAAARGDVGEPGGNQTGILRDSRATLYQKNAATARLTSDKMTADKQSRTVVATGNVVAQSLTGNVTTLRADTMTWHYETDVVEGKGHVLLTQEPFIKQFPAAAFTANTKLQKVKIKSSGLSATGSF